MILIAVMILRPSGLFGRAALAEGLSVPSPADTPEAAESQSRIGKDDWVASVEGRRDTGSGVGGAVRLQVDRIPHPTYFVLFTIAAFLVPAFTSNGYILRVGFDTLIYMLLALGLNIVVGFAGLLDLGYAAFFGFGAYGYAMLASSQFHQHWPTLAILVLVTLATACLGFIVALPSRRLVGDYLAIVTLFFGELFVTVTNNGESISFLGLTKDYNVTNGPNGIANIDPFHLFGHQLESLQSYYYVALVFFLVVLGTIHLVNRSRTGRAWRAIREDPLAAELMGTPVNRLKLYAFAFGAGVAGLTGTLFASLNTAVFSSDFDTPVLITVYAILILGGAGSLGGVILGALIVNVTLEVLRTPNHATWVFFILIGATLVAKLRPWKLLAAVVAEHARARLRRLRGREGDQPELGLGPGRGHRHAREVRSTTGSRCRANPTPIGNYAFIALTAAVLALTAVRPFWRNVMLPLVLYLAVFTWDVRLAFEPSDHPADHDRGDPDRPDERAAPGAARPGPGRDRMSRLLDLRGVTKSFGGLVCIDGLDLHVDEHEIVSVIGPNGAGKTTLFNLITGIYAPDGGAIDFDGRSLLGLDPHVIVGRGVARTFQTLRLFLNMTREGERDGGRLRPHARRDPPLDPAHAADAPRGDRDRRARRGAARLLRRPPDGLPLEPARLQPLLRQPAAPRDRAGDGDEAAPPPPRRAGRRDEPGRDP